jgi:eukaryotic-like serine/threonine-protein kinase
MELLTGEPLDKRIERLGRLSLQEAARIIQQVCRALARAHEKGIIHRDLKPENVFLCQQGGIKDYPKVLDFGLAKVTERQMRPGSVILTQEGMVFGTPEFMSPEQAQGKTLTPGSDIYSLAVILYEVLTGKLPFDAKTAMDFLQLHVTAPPIALNKRVAGKVFPVLLEEVVARALAKKPEHRFASAADFASALQAVLEGQTELPAQLAPSGTETAATMRVNTVPATDPPSPQPLRSPAPPGRVQPDGDRRLVPRSLRPGSSMSPASSQGPQKVNLGVLVGVAVAFMALGVGLAILVMRAMGR